MQKITGPATQDMHCPVPDALADNTWPGFLSPFIPTVQVSTKAGHAHCLMRAITYEQ